MVILNDAKKTKKNLSKDTMIMKKENKKNSGKKSKGSQHKAKIKKEDNKKISSKPKKLDNMTVYGAIAGTLAVIAVIFFLVFNNTDIFSSNEMSSQGKVLVKVNGVEITDKDIDAIYESIPPERQVTFTKKTILESIVNETILMQRAEIIGLNASKEEIDQFMQMVLMTNQITEEQLVERLKQQGLNMTELYNELEKQIILSKLFEADVNVENATEQEASAFYEENKEFFALDNGTYIEFESVKQEIKNQIEAQKRQESYNLYIKELKDNAEIEYFD